MCSTNNSPRYLGWLRLWKVWILCSTLSFPFSLIYPLPPLPPCPQMLVTFTTCLRASLASGSMPEAQNIVGQLEQYIFDVRRVGSGGGSLVTHKRLP